MQDPKDLKSLLALRFVKAMSGKNLDSNEVFVGLVEAMLQDADRKHKGKGMQNFKYEPAYDSAMHEISLINAGAAKNLRKNFVFRTQRNYQ